MPFQDGDVIEFDYELWVDGKDQVHDTTLREVAQAAGILEPNAFYAPMSYVVGSGRLIPGLEKALRAAEVGATQTVDLPPADAYGERDPNLIETLPIKEFKQSDVAPHPGMQITRQNRRGIVTTVGGGRVRVDFNHPLAGKALRYRFTVRRAASSDPEKVEGLLRMHFPAPLEWQVQAEGPKTVRVDVPEAAVYHQNWVTAKIRVVMDARRHTDLDEVRFLEPYRLRTQEEERKGEKEGEETAAKSA